MIDKVLELSLRQRAFVLLAALALVAVGLWSAARLSIDAVPDITGVQVQINTEVPALAAEESERLVTRPIEIEMAGLPGLEEMRSLTKFGLSQVTLLFADGTDIYRARQLVTERLQAAVERLRSEEHTSELQSPDHLVCRLLLEKKKNTECIVSSVFMQQLTLW